MESRVTITGDLFSVVSVLVHDRRSEVRAGFYCCTISYIGDAGTVNKQK